MTEAEYFGDWYKCIDKAALAEVKKQLDILYKTKLVCPHYIDVFKAFKLCDYNNLSVVMLGMDPYPQKDVATGLAFANKDKVESPSLKVIQDTLGYNINPTLESWARQGVLLLNSALTVEMNKVGSHIMMWKPFISSFLKGLGEWQTGIIYVLLGKQAQTFKPYIGRFNDIIECNHPSYYARTGESMPNIFNEINKLTISKNNYKIKWV